MTVSQDSSVLTYVIQDRSSMYKYSDDLANYACMLPYFSQQKDYQEFEGSITRHFHGHILC